MGKQKPNREFENNSDELLKESKRKNSVKIIAGIVGGAAILAGACLLIFHSENEDEALLREYESFMGETYETVEIDGKTYLRTDKEDPDKLKSMDDIRKELGTSTDFEVIGSIDMTGRDPEETESAANSASETQTGTSEEETETFESKTESGKEYKPGEITFEEYLALTPKEQDAYVLRCKKDKNYGLDKFMEWYKKESEQYNSSTEAPTTIHPGDVIEFGK